MSVKFFRVLLARRQTLRIIYSLTHLHFLLIISNIHEVMQHFGAIESNEIEFKQIGAWLRLATMIDWPFSGIFSWFSNDLTLLHHILQDVTLMCQIWFLSNENVAEACINWRHSEFDLHLSHGLIFFRSTPFSWNMLNV